MQACETMLKRDEDSAALIASRHVMPAYDAEAMRALPKGSLGKTYISVLDGYGYDINFSPKQHFLMISRPMQTISTFVFCKPTIFIT